tara:strand:+ start:3477 stop:4559 length:1083 start_codon:yes stop_codon:yes gene_type:complete
VSLYIGLMSGTSADGMDVALVDFSSSVHLVDALCLDYPADLRTQLRSTALAPELPVKTIMQLDRTIAARSAEAVAVLLQRNGLSKADIHAIGSHGHTLRHKSQPDGFSWQIGDPSWIAEHTGITCIADFRRRDIAAGGQGAPLVPAFHQHCLSQGGKRMVLNIGGIANLTVLPTPGTELLGFDTGPGNALMDEWCQRELNCARDEYGQMAAQGNILHERLHDWLTLPYFSKQPPKSTGRELFNLNILGDLSREHSEDVLATLTELSACSISNAVKSHGYRDGELLICGGGLHNHFLLKRIQHHLPQADIKSTEKAGIHPDWLEAMAFAWLAWRTDQHLSGNAPAVTGASGERILGGIYPA